MKEYKKDYINYRIERAWETFEVAVALYNKQNWFDAINRFYYACFYIVDAALNSIDITSKTHSGKHRLFNQQFVKSGKVPERFGALFTKLQQWRIQSDYGEFFQMDEQKITEMIPMIREFIKELEKFIRERES